jgi:hypothetical protein
MTREIKNILRETINDLRNNNIGVLKANNYESTYFDLTPAKTDYASLKINSIVVYIIDGEAVVDVFYKIENGKIKVIKVIYK